MCLLSDERTKGNEQFIIENGIIFFFFQKTIPVCGISKIKLNLKNEISHLIRSSLNSINDRINIR